MLVKTPSGVLPSDLTLGTDLGALRQENGVRLLKDSGGYSSLSSVEATARLFIGTDGQDQSAYSELTGMDVGDRTHLHGVVKTAGSYTHGANVLVDGSVTANTSLRPLATLSWNVAFPSLNRGSCDLQPDLTETIDPGTYGAISVKARSHLKLRAGTYYFTSLSLEATAVLDVDNAAGPVFVNVRNAFAWSGSVVETQPTKGNVVFGLATNGAVNILTAIRGIVIAPSATLTLASDGSSGHFGSFFAKTLTAQANATFHQRPLSNAAVCPGATDCNALCPCAGGGLCQSDSECQAGFTCQPPSGGGAKICTPVNIDDGNPCTADSVSGGTVVHTPLPAGTSCSDGNACNGAETCNATAVCVAGTPPTLDDGNPCTTDTCTPATGVTHTPVAAGTSCSDGNVCNGAETCNASAVCVAGAPPSLDDGNACTTDACTAASGVTHTPVAAGTSCSDGNVCNGAETCNASAVCVAGAPPSLDDGNVCTTDACTAASGISHTPVAAGTSCGDGNPCNGAETCDASGQCTPGSPVVCVALDQCHDVGTCSAATGTCSNPAKPNGTACSDGNACTQLDTCQAGSCASGSPVATDDGNPCTTDSCSPTSGVTHTPVAAGTSCSDGNACNGAETCNGSAVCVAGTPPVVDDGNVCTTDACNPATGVTHTPVAAGTSCSDGNACNGAETCDASATCVSGTPPVVDDGNPCTADACSPSVGVSHTAVSDGTSCSDGNACNGTETCQAGTCAAGTAPSLDDGNPCTTDSCDPASGPKHTPAADGTSCSNGDLCDGDETCHSGSCTPGTPVNVDDGNPCTIDACSPVSGTVTHVAAPNGTTCADSNVCNGTELCVAGACAPGTPLDVSDGNACTNDSCDPAQGVIHTPSAAGTSCADSDLCNGTETCNGSGSCQPGTPVVIDTSNVCSVGTCNPVTGVVSYAPAPIGTSCTIDQCTIAACDGAGECTASGPSLVDDGDPCTLDTCDPVTGPEHHSCTKLDPGVPHTVFSETQWIYSGSDPIQVGVTPGTIAAQRAAALKGRIVTRDGSPLGNVTVSVLNHPEYGFTVTQANGNFDLVVNGGGQLTLDFDKQGYLEVQRQVNPGWSEWLVVPDAIMIQADPIVTPVDLASPTAPIQVAQGSTQTDSSGTRKGTLLIPAGVQATMTKPDGTTTTLPAMNVRITEFTVGANGPDAMPAALPAQSAYTYAFEVNADEAVEAGADEITFSQPLPYYNDNFLNFPAGTTVPAGAYHRDSGKWVPEQSGIVLKIISVTGGLANIDVTGDNVADTGTALTNLGITSDERQTLATLYSAGKSLWRVRIGHFTEPWDFNWGFQPPGDAIGPSIGPLVQEPVPDEQCHENHVSTIECESQFFNEEIPIAGTNYKLHYSSARVPGYRVPYHLDIPISGAQLPPSLKRIELTIQVGGRRFSSSYLPNPNQTIPFDWDGIDGNGRRLNGQQRAVVTITYVYDMQYTNTGTFSNSGNAVIVGDFARSEALLSKTVVARIGTYTAEGLGLGGWMVDAVSAYDPQGLRLESGDGDRQSDQGLPPTVRRVVQSTCGNCFPPPDGSIPLPPLTTSFSFSLACMAGRPDGAVYLAETYRIWRLDPDGHIFRIAGNGSFNAPDGDNGPALNATINVQTRQSMAVGPDGTIYIAESNNKIRRIDTDGIIRPFAGTGAVGGTGDGGPAANATFGQVPSAQLALSVGPDGSVYVADFNGYRIRKIDTKGIITTIAGHGPDFSSPLQFGVSATLSVIQPEAVTAAPDGTVYFSEYLGGSSAILQVGLDGKLRHIAGCLQGGCPTGDGFPADQTQIITINNLLADENGITYDEGSAFVRRVDPTTKVITTLSGSNNPVAYTNGAPATSVNPSIAFIALVPDALIGGAGGLVSRIDSPMPGITVGNRIVPKRSNGMLVNFDGNGRNIDIRHSLTGTPLMTFGYTGGEASEFDHLTDANGRTTHVERDSFGKPTAIVGPYGQRTTLELDSHGWLSAVVDPEGDRVEATYTTDGLLQTFKRANGGVANVGYDPQGRLTSDVDAVGGSRTLVRTSQPNGFDVAMTTGLGHTQTYKDRFLALNTRTQIQPSGVVGSVQRGTDQVSTFTEPDGTIVTTSEAPDARFGVAAPIVSTTTKLPSGLTSTHTYTRPYTSLDPLNPFSFTDMTEQLVANGRTWRTLYTPSNRTLVLTSPVGRTLTKVIDTFGRSVTSQRDSLAAVNLFYDTDGRLDHLTQGSGASARTISYTYTPSGSAAGYVATITDPMGDVTSFATDSLGRAQTIARANATLGMTWDQESNVLSVTPPDRPAHNMTYTPISLLETYQPPPAGLPISLTGYSYDIDRLLRNSTTPDGLQIVVTPDAFGRIDTIAIPGGLFDFNEYPVGSASGAGETSDVLGPYGVNFHVTYDGFLVKTTSWAGDVTGNVSWNFNSDFQKTLETVNGATGTLQAAFGYDTDQFLTCASPTTCSPGGADALTLARNSAGLVSGITLGSTGETVTYNGFGELARQTATFGTSTPLVDITYDASGATRDKLGRVTQRSETITGVNKTIHFTYDNLRRLTDVTVNGSVAEHFEYDTNGNRTLGSSTATGLTSTGVYDDQDRLKSYGPFDFTYTANGELATKTNRETSAKTTYQYDIVGNLLSVSLPNGDLVEYLVDGVGRRVAKKKNGVVQKQWLYRNGLQPVAELDGAGAVVSMFVYGSKAGVPDYVQRGGVTYRVISDQLGSPRYVVNSTNASDVPFKADYTTFGEVSGTGLDWMPFGFAGGRFDSDTGLVRFGARDYDPAIGRFTTKDPLVFGGGETSLYGYCGGDPVNCVDPSGLAAGIDDALFFAGGAIAGLAGQAFGDLLSGQVSGWQDYVAAGVGGGFGGWMLMYTGPAGAGAIGGAIQNLTKQGLNMATGRQRCFHTMSFFADTALGAGIGKLVPGVKVPGITSGRNSYNAIFKQMKTKFLSNQIDHVSAATAGKMFAGRAVDTSLLPGALLGSAAGVADGNYWDEPP
jgi:RHS repeat-associated protein